MVIGSGGRVSSGRSGNAAVTLAPLKPAAEDNEDERACRDEDMTGATVGGCTLGIVLFRWRNRTLPTGVYVECVSLPESVR